MMTVVLPTEQVQVAFEQYVLQGWHEAHGVDGGRVCASWGEDRVVVMIEDVLFEAERLLTQSEQGKVVLEEYVRGLMGVVIEERAQRLSELLGREIVSASVSVHMVEQWVMFIFRLE